MKNAIFYVLAAALGLWLLFKHRTAAVALPPMGTAAPLPQSYAAPPASGGFASDAAAVAAGLGAGAAFINTLGGIFGGSDGGD